MIQEVIPFTVATASQTLLGGPGTSILTSNARAREVVRTVPISSARGGTSVRVGHHHQAVGPAVVVVVAGGEVQHRRSELVG